MPVFRIIEGFRFKPTVIESDFDFAGQNKLGTLNKNKKHLISN